MSLSIREGRIGDAPALAALLEQLGYRAQPGEVARRIGALPDDVSSRLLLAEQDEEVVGLLHLAVLPVFYEGARWERVAALVTREDRRRAGVARALLREAERIAGAEGCSIVEITTSASRHVAHGFYRAAGYEEASRRLLKRLERGADAEPTGS